MKKFLIVLISVLLILAFSTIAFAEEAVTEPVTETVTGVGFFDLFIDPSVDKFMDYIGSHVEEISVILTLIFSALLGALKNKQINSSVTTLNNNSVAVANNSLESMKGMSAVVEQYKEAMANMLSEIRRNDKERASLEESLAEVSKYLKSTRLANVELANEIAALLVLANIPNSVKEDLHTKHRAAVNAIAEAEREASKTEEVKENEETNEE